LRLGFLPDIVAGQMQFSWANIIIQITYLPYLTHITHTHTLGESLENVSRA